MSLWGHCQVNSAPKYRSWAGCKLGAVSVCTAKLNGALLGMHKFCCLVGLDTPVSWYEKCQNPFKYEHCSIEACWGVGRGSHGYGNCNNLRC